MAKLSQLTIPVKNPSSGVVTSQTFNLAGSGGGGSDTNFIGTKAAYDALPSSEKENYESMDFTDYHDGLNIDPAPMINSKNPVASGGVYSSLQNVNSEIEDLHSDVTDAVELVAPLESTLVASRAYAIGDQFVYDGFLYKVIAAIALDDPIVIGTNCQVAPNVSEQIQELTNQITNNLLSNIEVYQTAAYSGTVSNDGTIASITLPKGKYIVIPCGYSNYLGGYIWAISQWVSGLSILTLSSQQTLAISTGTGSAVTFTDYQVKFIKIG